MTPKQQRLLLTAPLVLLIVVIIAVIGLVSSQSSDVAGAIIRNLGLTGEAARAVTSAISTAEHRAPDYRPHRHSGGGY